MNIAIVRHSIRNRGGDRLSLDYFEEVLQKGHRVTYWTNEVNTHFNLNPKIDIKNIPMKGILGTIAFALTHKFEDDIVLVDLVIMAFCVSLRNRKKIIYLAQDWDVTYYRNPLLKSLIHGCYHIVLNMLQIKTIAVSDALHETLTQYRPKNLHTIVNGVDLNTFYREERPVFNKNREKKFVILLFARDDFRKGLDIAQKTLIDLHKMRALEDWEVWAIGSVEVTIEGVHIKNFPFLKTDEELRDMLSAVDIYLVSSRSEGLSLLLLKAMACGCAVISTAASTILKHEENALISPIEDWHKLAVHLNRVMDDGELLIKLRKNGSSLIKNYDGSKSRKEFEQILSKQA